MLTDVLRVACTRPAPRTPMARCVAILTAGAASDSPDLTLDLIQEVDESGDFLLPAMTSLALALYRALELNIGPARCQAFLEHMGLLATEVDDDIAAVLNADKN